MRLGPLEKHLRARLIMDKKTATITGMTCAACARRIEKVIGKLSGVTEASVNFATEKLTVAFDDSQISMADVQNAIVKIGYGVEEETHKRNNHTHWRYDVRRMRK